MLNSKVYLNAKDARTLAEGNNDILKSVLLKVSDAADKGKISVHIDNYNMNDENFSQLSVLLKGLGYRVIGYKGTKGVKSFTIYW